MLLLPYLKQQLVVQLPALATLLNLTAPTTAPATTPAVTVNGNLNLDLPNMPVSFPANPAWKPLFEAALKSQPVTFFQLATVAEPLVPRVRTLHFRGFLGESPEPASSPSALLYTTTDTRSKKFSDLSTSSSVEACFFVAPLWQQYRVRGRAVVVSPGQASGRKELEPYLAENWDWSEEFRRTWQAQDKHFKSKFRVEEGVVPDEFGVLVIVPEQVEELKNDAYTTWTLKAAEGAEVAEWVQRVGH